MATLRETNTARLKRAVESNPEVKRLRESIKRKFGFDMLSEKDFPVGNDTFSWKSVREKLELREADSATSFVQVLRAGVQQLVNQMYLSVETTFEDWAKVITSDKDTELYAPLHGIGFPNEIARQSVYHETGAAGLDIKLANRKYGEIFGVEMELLNDDQTGQFQAQVKLIAEYLKQVLEVLSYAKLNSITGQSYAGLVVPVSETQPSYESNYPWSAALKGGGVTKAASPTAFAQAAIQAGMIQQMNQLNLLGLKMSLNPKRLIIGPKFQFDAAVLLNSAFYPSGAASSGVTGGSLAINPIKGILDLTVSRFMFDNNGAVDGTSKAWYIVSEGPAFVVQVREAATVLQEAPNAGESFTRDVVRFKGTMRANADFIDPRWFYQGSDGSA